MSQDKTAPMAPFKYHTNGRNWFVTGQDHYGGRAYVADIHHCRDQDGNKCAEEIARLFAAAPRMLAALREIQNIALTPPDTTLDGDAAAKWLQNKVNAIRFVSMHAIGDAE